tara:strand:- start:1484 stop:2062 length:579 start_codon:yes stop_codon:yes gene_type:complete
MAGKAKLARGALEGLTDILSSTPIGNKRRIIDLEDHYDPMKTFEVTLNPTFTDIKRLLNKSAKTQKIKFGHVAYDPKDPYTWHVPHVKFHINPETEEIAVWDALEAQHNHVGFGAPLWPWDRDTSSPQIMKLMEKLKDPEVGRLPFNEGHIQQLPDGKIVVHKGWDDDTYTKPIKNEYTKIIEGKLGLTNGD